MNEVRTEQTGESEEPGSDPVALKPVPEGSADIREVQVLTQIQEIYNVCLILQRPAGHRFLNWDPGEGSRTV